MTTDDRLYKAGWDAGYSDATAEIIAIADEQYEHGSATWTLLFAIAGKVRQRRSAAKMDGVSS